MPDRWADGPSGGRELIDLCPGRLPLIRLCGVDVLYDCAILGGEMAEDWFRPRRGFSRLMLRIDPTGQITAWIARRSRYVPPTPDPLTHEATD